VLDHATNEIASGSNSAATFFDLAVHSAAAPTAF